MTSQRKPKLTYEQAEEIRELYAKGKGRVLQKDLAKQYGVNDSTIAQIIRGESYTGQPPIKRAPWGEPAMSQKDIAAEIGITTSGVDVAEKRALAKLRAECDRLGLTLEDLIRD